MTSLPEDSGQQEPQTNPLNNPEHLESIDNLLDLLLAEESAQSTNSLGDNEDEVNLPDIEVEIDTEMSPKMTLLQAVEYKAFLNQTLESESDVTTEESLPSPKSADANLNLDSVSIVKPDHVLASPEEEQTPNALAELQQNLTEEQSTVEDLATSLNSIIPLITELLSYKINDSRHFTIQTIVPIIDQVIAQRSIEEAEKMATVLGEILPQAIAQKIKLSPQAVAKALAPEIALAMKEQILLDSEAIAEALGSEMGKAIKTQIEVEKDAMVDALYPVIGNTISKYMVEVIQSINDKVENALSIDGFKRKIRAKLQGVSEAELIFKESLDYRVQAVFLIDKNSGLVIKEIQPNSETQLESDLIGGMLTAIRDFARDCLAAGSELGEIDYGDWKIPLEASGYCYLAVVIQGEPEKEFRERMRTVLGDIVLKYGKFIQAYDGNSETIPVEVQGLLTKLTQKNSRPTLSQASKSSPVTLIWLLAILCCLVFIPWGIVHYRGIVAHRIERVTAIQLDSAPELSVYRLDPQVKNGQLILTGRVPDSNLRELADSIGQKIATEENLELDNQIISVNIPPNFSRTARKVKELTLLLNKRDAVAISSNYEANTLTIEGFVLDEGELKIVYSAFKQVPGIETVIVAVENKLPSVDSRIYFTSGSAELKSQYKANGRKIKSIKQLLIKYPQLNLRLIAHTDSTGSPSVNRKLQWQRARNVQAAIISQGIDENRLEIQVSDLTPPGVTKDRELWLSRCVRFESFIPTNSNN